MEQLRKSIEEEQLRIKQELESKDKKQEFYREFFAKHNCTTIDGLLKAKYSDIVIAIIARKDSKDDIDTIKNAVYTNKIIFELLNKEAYEALFKSLGVIKHLDIYDELHDILKEEKIFILKNPFKFQNKVINKMRQLLKQTNIPQPVFADFMDLYKHHGKELAISCSVIGALKELKKDIVEYENEIKATEEEFGVKLKDKVRAKALKMAMKENWNINGFTAELKEARRVFDQKEQDNKVKQKNLIRTQDIYNNLEKQLLNALQNKEVKNVEDLINKIPSESVRKQILRIIYTHNQTFYKELTSEYENISSNTALQYQSLLSKHGITPESYDPETIMDNSLTDVEKMLEKMSKLGITTSKDVLKTLQQSNLEIITNYSSLIDKGIITNELISSNKNSLDKSSDEYANFMRNIALLQEKRINPYCISEAQDVFTTPHTIFRKNIQTIEEYGLTKNLKSGINSSFLAQEKLNYAIDTLLELGYEKYLENCPELLNYSDRFARLQIVKELNIPISNKEELIELLTTEKFFLSDDEITDYVYNAVDFNLPYVTAATESTKDITQYLEKLEAYDYKKRTYNLDGVLISKNKVARNLSTIDPSTENNSTLLYGIIAGSTLSDEELSKIKGKIFVGNSENKIKQKK